MERNMKNNMCVCVCVCVYMYMYNWIHQKLTQPFKATIIFKKNFIFW